MSSDSGGVKGGVNYLLGIKPPSEEERKKALEEKGPSWREWAFQTGLKPYVGLGLLVGDGLVLASLEEAPVLWVKWMTFVAVPFLIYLDLLAYLFLWAAPPDPLPKKSFHPTLFHPFLVGRWHSSRVKTLRRMAQRSRPDEVSPEEFL